jgi:hypothetical protein
MTSATTKSRQHVPVTRLHPRYIVEQQSIKIRSFVPSRDQSRWKHSYSGGSEIAIIVMPFQFGTCWHILLPAFTIGLFF